MMKAVILACVLAMAAAFNGAPGSTHLRKHAKGVHRNRRLGVHGSAKEPSTGTHGYVGPKATPLLDSIHSPADMKRLTVPELSQLAYELR